MNKLEINADLNDLEGEIWKSIDNTEGNYLISNYSRIKSLRRIKPVIMHPKIACKIGYPMITILINEKEVDRLVHRLVAIAFLDNPNNLPLVHHKDNNRLNYNLSNLEWVSRAENNKKAREDNRHIGRVYKKFKSKQEKLPVPSYYTDLKFNPIDEIWVDIQGFEGKYKISNYGRVLSLKRKERIKDKLLKPKSNQQNYLHVSFWTKTELGYKGKHFSLHRLVMLNFVPNPENLGYVNHKDFNPHNNHISNLEWISFKGNIDHAREHGVIDSKGERSAFSKLTDIKVLEIRELHKNGLSNCKISKLYNVNPNTIGAIVKRKTWVHI